MSLPPRSLRRGSPRSSADGDDRADPALVDGGDPVGSEAGWSRPGTATAALRGAAARVLTGPGSHRASSAVDLSAVDLSGVNQEALAELAAGRYPQALRRLQRPRADCVGVLWGSIIATR